ncbi:MAG: thioredoxin [Crocinitomicaceae bacterium]|nr:thioredoxin [Crocinitomicaceae bacterium]
MGKFQEVIDSETPTLVDFYATWCGPCKTIAPILEEVKNHFGGNLTIIKVDVDKNPAAAGKFGVRGVPNLILFKKGEIVWQQAGVIPKNQLIQMIDPSI